MIKFEHLKVYNMIDALRGMRNPMESWDKGDSEEYFTEKPTGYSSEIAHRDYSLFPAFDIGPNDLRLAKALSKAGNDHAKFLRQIFVSVDIIAPIDLWLEIDTYKVATVRNSTSTMHKLGSRYLNVNDFSFEDFTPEQQTKEIERLNAYLQDWWDTGKRKPSTEWRRLKRAMAEGFLYRSTWTANYQVLKMIVNSDRKNHRLSEWHDFINYFTNSLPYFKEICVDVYEEKE